VDFFYDGPGPWRFGRYGVWVYHTPGHCPGGVCLAIGREAETARTLFVGDTLFAGSIGRTDLPGGNHELLLQSIRDVLFRFPDDTVVHPGHGQPTTIGVERRTNPFLQG
jgi:glyoxylase-like metal-dependent hydrolase (beta-lactamase superfamily II)